MSTHNPGLPDPALLAQWANAMFIALPGRPSLPGTAADAQAVPPSAALATTPPLASQGEIGSLPVAPYASPTSGFTPPSEVELRAAPASLSSLGSLPAPAIVGAPPEATSPYFLEPTQQDLPGGVPGVGASMAARLESGTIPVAPSPPSAFAQPAEPTPRSVPATNSEALVLGSAPYSFRPEFLAAPLLISPSTQPIGEALPDLGRRAQAGSVENPSASASPASPNAPFYFLDSAPVPFNAGPDFTLDLSRFPSEVWEFDLGLDPHHAGLPFTGVRP